MKHTDDPTLKLATLLSFAEKYCMRCQLVKQASTPKPSSRDCAHFRALNVAAMHGPNQLTEHDARLARSTGAFLDDTTMALPGRCRKFKRYVHHDNP
jgi:hypothetical protein